MMTAIDRYHSSIPSSIPIYAVQEENVCIMAVLSYASEGVSKLCPNDKGKGKCVSHVLRHFKPVLPTSFTALAE